MRACRGIGDAVDVADFCHADSHFQYFHAVPRGFERDRGSEQAGFANGGCARGDLGVIRLGHAPGDKDAIEGFSVVLDCLGQTLAQGFAFLNQLPAFSFG